MAWSLVILIAASVLTISFPVVVYCELYTAIVDLEPLLHTNKEIVRTLNRYLEKEEERLMKLTRLRMEYEAIHDLTQSDAGHFLANPVNAFLLVKRLTVDWETVTSLVEENESKAMIDEVRYQGLIFPSYEDLKGASAALMRLQDTYLLKTGHLARGEFTGAGTSTRLSAGDCFELGKLAYSQEDFIHAIFWLHESIKQLEDENLKSAVKISVLHYLAYSYEKVNGIKQAFKITKEILKKDPRDATAISNLDYFGEQMKKKFGNADRSVEYSDPQVVDENLVAQYEERIAAHYGDYGRTCRSQPIKHPKEDTLHCRYTSRNSSYLLLQPVREEELSLDPIILVYHNVLSNKDADLLKNISLPKLNRAIVAEPESGKLTPASYRVSKSAWLADDMHLRIARASRMISDVTSLDTRTAEDLHVINYGIGGHYTPHFDFRREHEADAFAHLGTGNRLATWIYYLSDVHAGGSTVFPQLGVEVKPEKGSACMWYNLKKNGDGILSTMHAGCPVLIGSKWVANKWLHERGQEFRYPCSLNRWE